MTRPLTINSRSTASTVLRTRISLAGRKPINGIIRMTRVQGIGVICLGERFLFAL